MKEWHEVTFMSTMATSRRWTYPNTFFRFQKRAILKFPEVQINFYLVNFMVCYSSYFILISTMHGTLFCMLKRHEIKYKRMIINFDIWSAWL